MMFGRVRAASTSPDCLERPPPKLLKHDPISIYEATLVKLKLGSRLGDINSLSDEAMEKETNSDSTSVSEGSRFGSSSNFVGAAKIEPNYDSVNNSMDSSHIIGSPHEEAMAIDTDCSSACMSPSSSCQSIDNSQQEKKRNVSVLYLFSKFKSSQNAPMPSCDETMVIENGYSSSNSLPNSSECLSFGSSISTESNMKEEHVSSLHVCQI